MEEQEFRETYKTVNNLPCPFEKAILSRRFGCEKCQKLNIAEREAAACMSPAAQGACLSLLDVLRQNALFALRLTSIAGSLPHGKEMKVQCGGMLGLRNALFPELASELRVDNIYPLVMAAGARQGGFEALPFQEIVKSIASFEARPRSGRHR
jgi:hypothetical protein